METVTSHFFQLEKKKKENCDCYPQGNQKFTTLLFTLPNHFYWLDFAGGRGRLLVGVFFSIG